ncbi:uncharacterized protein LOC115414988 [Sphaeramia orbicularis]|uniref:uncharacterized protein LOC115414988 n=1 Tax=Sphaeramia orbicularis TaxID=375764 RepID=UPI00117EE49E|nr:uncharacterized protein LOC115414988 [Sphaeramia orbicularis]
MAGFRCIQVFLFVILLLEFTVTNGEALFIYGRGGDGVTLPCTNVRDGQNQCNGTSWTFNKGRTRAATELIQLGKISEDAQDKSNRLNITEDCSLVFNKVKDEDAGLYLCRQYDESGHERGRSSYVELSVVSLTERQDGDDVTFICSVSTHGQCFSPVTWMFNGVEVEKGHPDMTISTSSCTASVTFNRRKYFYTKKAQVFKCAVRLGNKTEEFSFRRSSSEEQPDDNGKNNKNTTVTSTPTAPEMNTSGNSAAANGDMLYIYGRDGDGVTLPCTSVRDDQNQCDGTTWTINEKRTKGGIELIQLGKITENDQDKSDRLNITEDCSLVFNKVKDEDVGFYSCRQYDRSGQERGRSSSVVLSVVSLTERQDGDDVTLNCSVSRREQCISRVTWMYNDGEVGKDHPDLTISKPSCSAMVTFNRRKYFCSSKVQLFKCRVHHNKEKTDFPFRCSSSEEQPDDNGNNNKNTRVTPMPTAPEMNTSGNSDQWWIIPMVVVFVVIIVTVVVFIIWKKHKGKERQTNGDVALTSSPDMMQSAPETSHDLADPEDAVPYASISYTKKANSEARVLSKDDDDTVTYSAVKASSSSAAAYTDPSNLYATVGKD